MNFLTSNKVKADKDLPKINLKKRMKNKVIYLETSAINYLASLNNSENAYEDSIATRQYHQERGNRLMVSVVSIWEILMTSNEIERERLISFMQNALYPKLIFAPSEIIINFIEAGCPVDEPGKSIYTTLSLGIVWEDICQDSEKTFIFNQEDLKLKTTHIRKLFKRIDRSIEDIVSREEISNTTRLKEVADSLYNDFFLENEEGISHHNRKVCKLSIIFMTTVLCIGLGIDDSPIVDFWNKRGINGVYKRAEYICANYEALIHRGPIASMALMAYNQILEDKKPNRGLFWDALHSVYLPYVDILLTKDKHFKLLRERIDHVNYSKIKLIEEGIIKKRRVFLKRK